MVTDITTTVTPVQPRGPIVITGVPFAWGFQDGAKGESEFTGYDYFSSGPKLAQYREGWKHGQRVRTTRSN